MGSSLYSSLLPGTPLKQSTPSCQSRLYLFILGNKGRRALETPTKVRAARLKQHQKLSFGSKTGMSDLAGSLMDESLDLIETYN